MKSAGDTYEELAERFLEEQRSVLGEQAGRIADGVSGVRVNGDSAVTLDGDARETVDRLAREFRDMFGANVEESFLSAIGDFDHAVELPPSVDIDRELCGYTEYRQNGDWHAVEELDDVEPQPSVWAMLFGFGTEGDTAELDGQPIAERRGVPLDASDAVHDAWIEQTEDENGLLMATGHTWLTAAEIPDTLFARASSDLVGTLLATSERYGPDRARLVVWLRYGDTH